MDIDKIKAGVALLPELKAIFKCSRPSGLGLRQQETIIAALEAAQGLTPDVAVMTFATAILHGDEIHKAWLLEAAENFCAGKQMPPPRAALSPALEKEGVDLTKLESRVCELEKYSHRPVEFIEDENGFLKVDKSPAPVSVQEQKT